MFGFIKRIICDNKVGTAFAVANIVATLPYLLALRPGEFTTMSIALACVTLPLAFFTGRRLVSTFAAYSMDREQVLARPGRFVFQTAELLALSGVTIVLASDLCWSVIFAVPFALDALKNGVRGGGSDVFSGIAFGRVALLSYSLVALAAKGAMLGTVIGFVVFLLKK